MDANASGPETTPRGPDTLKESMFFGSRSSGSSKEIVAHDVSEARTAVVAPSEALSRLTAPASPKQIFFVDVRFAAQ